MSCVVVEHSIRTVDCRPPTSSPASLPVPPCRLKTSAARAGRPWADEWQPITYLKRQRGGEGDALYVKARAMEAAKYATRHAVVREEGGDERRSPRLAEAHVAAA